MKADRTPEIPGPPQKQAEEESEHPSGDCAHYGLARIEGVTQAEQPRHHERRRPEADSGSKCVLDVSATQEFFKQSDQDECDAPRDERGENCCPVKSQAGNTEPVKQ